MKVIHQSDAMLIVEDRPWLIGILMILMALVFLAGGMAMMSSGEPFGGLMMGSIGAGVPLLIAALMVKRIRLTFDRTSGRITRTSRSVLGLTEESYAMSRLEEARVGVSADSDGTTYRMELRLTEPTETVPFTSYYTSGKRPDQMAAAVNAWLESRSSGLTAGRADG